MDLHNLSEFVGGWIVGDFEPTLYKTKEFEVSIKYYSKGESAHPHIHKIAKEFTVIISGIFLFNGRRVGPGDIIILEAGEESYFSCIEEGANVVIKIPSVVGDKYKI